MSDASLFASGRIHFLSTVAFNHLPLFHSHSAKEILTGSLRHLVNRGKLTIYCFVLMPNHVHMIASSLHPAKVADVMRDFKSFTAHAIIEDLNRHGDAETLEKLRKAAMNTWDQVHRVWQAGYHRKDVFSSAFMAQKMAYIHNNPCQEKWSLARSPAEYRWSSAGFYLNDSPCILPIEDCRPLLAG